MNTAAKSERAMVRSDEDPDFLRTRLPEHWRRNKSLPEPFQVFCQRGSVPDGTPVILKAENANTKKVELRNYSTEMKNSVANFED